MQILNQIHYKETFIKLLKLIDMRFVILNSEFKTREFQL